MSRTPTETSTTVEWQERVTDPDSDSLTLSLTLDAVDDGSGFTNDGTDSSNLSWLSFSKTKNTLNDGTLEVLVDITANKSGLQQGYTYRFKVTADDGTTAVDRTFTLSIEKPPIFNGTMLFVCRGGDDEVASRDINTAFDLSSGLSNKKTKSVYNLGITENFGSSPSEVFMKPDGNKMYVAAFTQDDRVAEFDLTTAWDIKTASYNGVGVNPNNQNPNIGGLFFKKDGTEFWIGGSNQVIENWKLTTAWDLQTASHSKDYSMPNHDAIGGIYFRDDGKKAYTLDDSGPDVVREYDLTTAWDFGSRNLVNTNSDINDQTGFSDGLFFSNDGKKMWINNNGGIEKFTLNTAWDTTTIQYDKGVANILGGSAIHLAGPKP